MSDTLALAFAFGDVAFWAGFALLALAALGGASVARLPWRRRGVVALAVALAYALAVTLVARGELAAMGEAVVELERVDDASLTTLRRWSPAQVRALRIASLSPLHRGAVKRLLDAPPRATRPFPPADEATTRELRAWLRARGDCAHEALLDRRLGDFERAASSRCAQPGAARRAAEAALAMGDVERAWGLVAPDRARVHDGFDGRLLAAMERPSLEDLARAPAAPARELPMWGCVVARLRQRALGDGDGDVWAPLLESDSAPCRILAATAPARRDALALRALVRLPPTAQRAWSSALTAARVLINTGGKVPPVLCPQRRVAALDGAWLARYPALAEALLVNVRDESCALVHDRVWFPAMQARAWGAWADPERPSVDAFEDLIVGWQLVDGAWERMRTVLDARFTRARRAQLARSFNAALAPLAAWAVDRLDVAWAEGASWPRGYSWASVNATLDGLTPRRGFAYEAMLRGHDIPHYAIDGARRWDLDAVRVPAHNPTLSAWIDYWRTGTYAPPHDAPAWLRDDAMQGLVAAVEEGDGDGAARALGEPNAHNAERLAVVSYRLRGDGRRYEPWLRRAWGSVEPFAGALGAWERDLQTLRTCALRLRLPALRSELDRAIAGVRRARRGSDPFVQAVLDGPRPQPAVDDDDE